MSAYRVDLRSDTVTTPSPAMRRAMADAEVGDDWFGDDPTVNRLQERAAEVVGKEAALYVPTGTMANQIGLRLHFRGTGHLVLAEATAHVSTTEVMSSAALSGMAFRGLRGDRRGQITPEQVQEALAPDPEDVEIVDIVAVEDTHGHAGGRVTAMDDLRGIAKVAREHDLPVHLDGARIFNAAVASGVPVTEIAAEADTLMFCVSKALGAPIGSLVCGPAELMREARRMKILFGGAWRQAGVVAAAGLVALEEGPNRLHEDHERARRLAEGVASVLPGAIDPADVETNMVFVDTEAVGLDALEAIGRLRDLGVGATYVSRRVRMVTHVDIDDEDVRTALAAWRTVAADR
ncbi:MAG TPA: GntG family PLP-dependent aldolase [Actinomycetota bacterium]|nr:GntG family PLP-dependent aldolase [Actinomycetota bacterium]